MAAEHSPEPDPELVRHGRQYIWIAIGFLAVTSVVVAGIWIYRFGLSREYVNKLMIRWSLLALLGAFLLQGRAWARWLTVVLLMIGMYIGFPVFLRPGAWSREGLAASIAFFLMYTGYFVVARGLIYSNNVRAFFRAHRKRPRPAADDGPPSWQR